MPDNKDLVAGHAAHLPFPDDTFDTVALSASLTAHEHNPTFLDQGLTEAMRVVKPDGVILIWPTVTETDERTNIIRKKLVAWNKQYSVKLLQNKERKPLGAAVTKTRHPKKPSLKLP